jgi:DNA invertase Pin-like site-specific DNA recombinase
MKKIGYIQTTSKLQIEEQSEILISHGCSKIYVETSKELNYKQKQKLQLAIDSLNSKDILAVTRLSILCISVQSLLEVLFELNEKDVTLEVIQQKFISKDTHTLDELLLYIIEFIDDIKIEKQIYGIDKAKQDGKRLGRPLKLNQQQVLKAIELKKYSTSNQVATKFGVGRSTLLRHIAKQKKAS